MSRLIDADVLIEILTTAIRNMKGMAKFLNAEDDPEIKMEIKAYTDILNGVKEQPTIEPNLKWIPCSERLPEKYEYVLLCDREPEPDEGTGYSRMAVGWLEDGEFCCWDDRAARKEFAAWMPLPEPYKEDERK